MKLTKQKRYLIICHSLKKEWNNLLEFFIEVSRGIYEPDNAEKQRLELNEIASTFLHYEKLARIKYKQDRLYILTKNEFKELIRGKTQ